MKLSLSIKDLDLETYVIDGITYTIRFRRLGPNLWLWTCDSPVLSGESASRMGASVNAIRRIRKYAREQLS